MASMGALVPCDSCEDRGCSVASADETVTKVPLEEECRRESDDYSSQSMRGARSDSWRTKGPIAPDSLAIEAVRRT